MTTQITRADDRGAELRAMAARQSDAKVACRLLAIGLVLEGRRPADAARSGGMDRQTLRNWVIRCNEHGIDGLSDRHGGGSSPKLSETETAQSARWVEQCPEPEDGLVRWRLSDLRQRIMACFFVSFDERSTSRILKELAFSHVSVRPRHRAADADFQVWRDVTGVTAAR